MSKVPCGGFELDESLALNDGKLGLAPGAGGSQADWNVTDITDPAFIKNKPFGDVPGVNVFSSYSPSKVETNSEGHKVFTFTSSNYMTIKGPVIFTIGSQKYENIAVTKSDLSYVVTKYMFDTTGLPVIVEATADSSANESVVTVTLLNDGDYASYIIITDMGSNNTIPLSSKYIDTSITPSGLGYIFPTCSSLQIVKDKEHLIFQASTNTYIPSFDMYLTSNTGKIFQINVDDSGNLSAIQV